MKINFENYQLEEQFLLKRGGFCGIQSVLITPNDVGVKFTQKNKIFRSSIWTEDGELLSAGFPKFTNFNENPENFPIPESLKNTRIVEKIDGSLVCIDYINQLSMRTRGTFSVDSLENKNDFYYCISKHPFINDWLKLNTNWTILCEITTPNQKIVVDYGDDPNFQLIGAINKDDYSLATQDQLDNIAKQIKIDRPTIYSFPSIKMLLEDIEQWKGKEGVVIYSNNDQTLHKVKSLDYLKKHRFKSNATLQNTLDMYFILGKPSKDVFEQKLIEAFDYECYQLVDKFVPMIYDAHLKVNDWLAELNQYVDTYIRPLPTKKEQAAKIFEDNGKTPKSSILFVILSNKQLEEKKLKKLMMEQMNVVARKDPS